VPLSELERGAADLGTLDTGQPTIVYCAVGVRSLRGAGFCGSGMDFAT